MPEIDEVTLSSLTLEQKAALVTGATFWTTAEVPEAGIGELLLTDGPHGLRKQDGAADHLGLAGSVPATCFPPAAGLGSSFDPALAERVGAAIGAEAATEEVSVVLGPGLNIKRSPLCGRNFEYFSEDPLISGSLAAAVTRGIQSAGVAACPKHFAVNNQETDRMRVSAEVDERTLHEIYLRGFEQTISEAHPWTLMSSYNKVNGTYASESRWLLTEVLRERWGFDGLVVSDWFAVGDRVAALQAGLDLEMPTTGEDSPARVVEAVRTGTLDEAVLDDAVARILTLQHRVRSASLEAGTKDSADYEAHHVLAREAATRSAVLLKNEGEVLPLTPEGSVAVIGEFARTPRYQGAGSSLINPTRLDTALESMEAAAPGKVSFAPGFTFEQDVAVQARQLVEDAVAVAEAADTAVVFLGLPEAAESEGFDREHIDLPQNQLELLEAVVAANPRTVVVLSNGSAVALPFVHQVPAILEGWLLGQAGGSALADLLYGRANPSGRLTETIPVRLEDNPTYGNFPGEHAQVHYGEGIFVGYRWYDHRQWEVAFPFGHGLSYTRFEYSRPEVSLEGSTLTAKVTVTNTGGREGREIIQLYSSLPESEISRPPRELRAFQPVDVPAGESRRVTMRLPVRRLAYWDTRLHGWRVEPGEYIIALGASSRDIRSETPVQVAGERPLLPLTEASTLADAFAHPELGDAVRDQVLSAVSSAENAEAPFSAEGMIKLLESFPLGRLAHFGSAGLDRQDVADIIRRSTP